MIQGRIRQLQIEDGTSLGITVYARADDASAPVVICSPAMGVEATYYEPLVGALHARGLNVVTADLRGLGRSSVRAARTTDFGYHEMVAFDLDAVVDAVGSEFPGSQIFLLGHSLGGQLNCLFAAANPERVSGLILVATCSVFFNAYPFPVNIGILVLQQSIRVLVNLLGYFPGRVFRFGRREARSQMFDWAHQGWTGRYEVRGNGNDFEGLLAAMKLPVLSVSFTDDGYSPVQPTRHLLDKMKSATKTHLHFAPEDLGDERMGHFGWVKKSALVAPHLAHWLDEVAGRRIIPH